MLMMMRPQNLRPRRVARSKRYQKMKLWRIQFVSILKKLITNNVAQIGERSKEREKGTSASIKHNKGAAKIPNIKGASRGNLPSRK